MRGRSLLASLSFLGAVSLAAPAAAAPVEQLSCVADLVGQEKMEALGGFVVRTMGARKAGTPSNEELADATAYKAALNECAKQFVWHDNEIGNAQAYTTSQATRLLLKPQLEAVGINAASIDGFALANFDRIMAAANFDSASDPLQLGTIRDEMFDWAGVETVDPATLSQH